MDVEPAELSDISLELDVSRCSFKTNKAGTVHAYINGQIIAVGGMDLHSPCSKIFNNAVHAKYIFSMPDGRGYVLVFRSSTLSPTDCDFKLVRKVSSQLVG
jgi:hypothetical protein